MNTSYPKGMEKLLSGSINVPANTLKAALLPAAYTYSTAHEFVSQLGAREAWRYSFPLRASGQTRCPVGRGIRENYLGFGLSNPAGQAFTLDRVEILTAASKTRRV